MSRGNSTTDYFKVTVPYYIPIAIFGVFVGIAASGGVFNYNVIISFFSMTALVAAFNTFNGVTDFKIDLINKPYRPIPNGRMSRNTASLYSATLYTLSLFLAYQLTPQFFQVTIASIIVTVLYSFPYVRLRKRFLVSNLSGAILYGVLCPLAGWSLTPLNPIPFYIIGFTFLFSLSLSMSKDFEDMIGDKIYRMKTIPVVLGIEKAKLLSTLMLILSFIYLAALVITNLIKIQYLFVILTLPAFILLIRKMYRDGKSYYNSIEDKKVAKRIFLMLMVLAVMVEFLIGIIALFL